MFIVTMGQDGVGAALLLFVGGGTPTAVGCYMEHGARVTAAMRPFVGGTYKSPAAGPSAYGLVFEGCTRPFHEREAGLMGTGVTPEARLSKLVISSVYANRKSPHICVWLCHLCVSCEVKAERKRNNIK